LNQKINDAEAKILGVEVSESAADVGANSHWVTQAIQTSLVNALTAAKEVTAELYATQTEVNEALTALTSAMNNYNPQPGIAPVVTVTFVSGEGNVITTKIVKTGQPVDEPVNAAKYTNSREVYDAIVAADLAGTTVAAGWYSLAASGPPTWLLTDGGPPWDFNNPVNHDITLTAQWGHELIPFETPVTNAVSITRAINESNVNNPIIVVLPAGNTTITGTDLGDRQIPTANVTFVALGNASASITAGVASQKLFWLNGNSSITLGKNITLLGAHANRTDTLIDLAGEATFIMLDNAEIKDISGTAANETGIAATVGGNSKFIMEGGLIHGTDVTDSARKYIWVAVVVVRDYGNMILKNGKVINNWQNTRIAPADARNRGDLIPGKRIMGGDIFVNAATIARPNHAPVLEISGSSEVDFIFLAGNPVSFSPVSTLPAGIRPHVFYIGSNWTGRIGALILDGDGLNCFNGWLNEQFVGAAAGHTLTGNDINKIGSLLFYPSLISDGVPDNDLEERSDRIISNSGNNIGHLLAD